MRWESPSTFRAQVGWRRLPLFWLWQRPVNGLSSVGLASRASLGPGSTNDHSSRVIADGATSCLSLLFMAN